MIEWISPRLRRAYKRQPKFDVGERERKDEREASADLHPRSGRVLAARVSPDSLLRPSTERRRRER